MNRRDFLKKIGIGAAAVALPGVVIGAVKPEPLPVMTATEVEKRVGEHSGGNKLATIDQITREALRILEKSMLKQG